MFLKSPGGNTIFSAPAPLFQDRQHLSVKGIHRSSEEEVRRPAVLERIRGMRSDLVPM